MAAKAGKGDGASGGEGAEAGPEAPALDSVAVRGGRFLTPLIEHLRPSAARLTAEFNKVREGRLILGEHSVCLRHAALGVSDEELAAAAPLGWLAEDFRTGFFEAAAEPSLRVLSIAADAAPNLLRHRATGMIVPYRPARGDTESPAHRRLAPYIDAEFVPFVYQEAEFKFSMRLIFAKAPAGVPLFVVRAGETRRAPDGTVQPHRPRLRLNQWCGEAAELFPDVRLVSLADFVEDEGEAPAEPEGAFADAVFERLARHMVEVATG